MASHLDWKEVEDRLDLVEATDRAGIVSVYLEFEGRALEQRDMRGVRQTVNISTFCQHFRIGRQTFARWLRDTDVKEPA